MAASSIAAFWAIAFLLVIVPGPDWAFTVSAGLRGRSVLPAVGGIVLGYAAMTVVVAAGVGALVAGTPAFLSALTVAGGLYLMWQGTMTVARPSAPGATAAAPARTGLGTLARGIGVSGLNPKGLLLSSRCSLSSPTRAGAGRWLASSVSSGWSSCPPARSSTSAWGLSRGRSCTPARPPRAPSPGSREPR
jgi:threonine/homoserine/homoserine lactone efflux protein